MSSETVQLKMITPAPITNGSQPGETIRIGTRKSPLALIQVDQVVEILKAAHPHINFSTHTVSVQGDRDKTSAFLYMKKDVKSASEAMKNLWTIEMEEMLLRNDLDMLVHCLKDMPTTLPEGCTLGSIILREDPRDALVMRKDLPFRGLDELAPGAVVGCCSARRKALVMRSYPHLVTQDCRGNVDSRVRKLDAEDSPYSCIIVGVAGMIRLALENRITKRLTPPEYPWAVGQGALGIEIRKSDTKLQCMLDTVQDLPTRWMALSERALLHALNGGCSSPVAVGTSYIKRETTMHSRSTTSSLEIRLHATIVEPSGARDMSITDCAIVSNDSAAEELGVKVALQLFDAGAKEMLERIKQAGTDAYNAQKETQRAKTLPSHD